jgi:hypothetical protein
LTAFFLICILSPDEEEIMKNDSSKAGLQQRKGQVIKAYKSACPDPLVVKAGEELAVEDKESEWSGWIWCTNKQGRNGWVPEKYIERKGDTCNALRDYDAAELSARVGEKLSIIFEESGWVWCTRRNGEKGWIPLENIEVL